MKPFLFVIVLLIAAHTGNSQAGVYDASTIPDSLLKDAHSVKREEIIRFDVKDASTARLSVHCIYTVLDAEAEPVLTFEQGSDEFSKLEDAEIRVFDAHGNPVNRYKMKEMKVVATGEGLVVDGEEYYFRVAAPSYPLTVEYDYDVKLKGTLAYPDYQIQVPEQSVENSTCTVTVPEGLDVRFKPQHIHISPVLSVSGTGKTYVWQVRNLKALPDEVGCASYESSYPAVLLAPDKFSMDGHDGDLSSWRNFGLWYANLAHGSINLSDNTKALLRGMVEHARSDSEKIAILYHYLQNNCRYVGIELGIGGFRPFDANFVDQKKYGDCKALSNYMEAMLDAVGIVSYPALVNASYNKQPVDPAFPHNSFNHVILCVPGRNDTTWLDCTDAVGDPGILGTFTENRNALLVTPEGGVLVATPESRPAENTLCLKTRVVLSDDGSGEGESQMESKGEYKEEVVTFLMNEGKDDQKKYLVQRLGFAQPDAFELNTSQNADRASTSLKLEIEKVPQFMAGTKMFLNPRICELVHAALPDTKNRTKAFYFPFPFIKADTTIYQLPSDYTVETLPAPKKEQFAFGSFRTSYSYDDVANTITTIASLELNRNIIPPDQFSATRQFFQGVMREYQEKIVIRQK